MRAQIKELVFKALAVPSSYEMHQVSIFVLVSS